MRQVCLPSTGLIYIVRFGKVVSCSWAGAILITSVISNTSTWEKRRSPRYLASAEDMPELNPGFIDGVDGPKTRNAISEFEKVWGEEIHEDQLEKVLKHCVGAGITKATVSDDNGWNEIEYFSRDEFACKCGQYHAPYCDGYPAEMDLRVVKICDNARKHFGTRGHVVSGLRCKQHNIDSGGVANSQHQFGEAVDIRYDGKTADEVLAYFLKQPGVRYAYKINATNVHVDVPAGER